MKIRVGMGYDVHQLVEGRDLWMGGIKIEHSKGLLGHSDADVLLHAICDALLGAANMRDIGYHFPDTAEFTDGMDSKVILKKTIELIATKGYHLVNIDATICAERPKMNPHIPEMKACVVTRMISPSRPQPLRNSALQAARKVFPPTPSALSPRIISKTDCQRAVLKRLHQKEGGSFRLPCYVVEIGKHVAAPS